MLIIQTPLRISFFGGGTDLKEFYRHTPGAVLSTAIDKYIYVLVKERFDDRIVLGWSRKEIVSSIEAIQHELVREAMRVAGIGPGIEVVTIADIPSEGSGLGSSSTLTVGLLNAFQQYRGEILASEELAREAAHIEIVVLRRPIGKQDHYAAALGDLRQFIFRADETVESERVALPPSVRSSLENNLLMFFTNRTRAATTILKEQQSSTAQKRPILSRMHDHVVRGRALLETGDLDAFGRLLHEAWELKRQLAPGISDPEIDALYSAGLKAGAMGGKILGAGGGGFLLFYCPMARQDALRQAMRDRGLSEMPFHFERDGTKAIFNIRRDTWKAVDRPIR